MGSVDDEHIFGGEGFSAYIVSCILFLRLRICDEIAVNIPIVMALNTHRVGPSSTEVVPLVTYHDPGKKRRETVVQFHRMP